jgi:hypothetical protein
MLSNIYGIISKIWTRKPLSAPYGTQAYRDRMDKIFPRNDMNKMATGTYVIRDGKHIKISDKASIKDFVYKKHEINGEHDTYKMYKKLERKGELNKVDDNWQGFLKNYKTKHGGHIPK